MTELLLCTDMDRTVIPNGFQQESKGVDKQFKDFCSQSEVSLVYVTGRHLALMQEAIETFDLPMADFAITDVGSRIYQRQGEKWESLAAWDSEIGQDWQDVKADALQNLVASIDGMSVQEPEKQYQFKISFYVDLSVLDEQTCLQKVSKKLESFEISSNLIWSIDETTNTGLLDILPPKANKLHAILFLKEWLRLSMHEIVFAGDSGNDIPVLISPVQAVLVANATEVVKQKTQNLVKQQGTQSQFYQAVNNSQNEGHYRGGVLQGVFHYRPELKKRFEKK